MLTGNTRLVGCPLGAFASSVAACFACFARGCEPSASDWLSELSCFAASFRFGGIGGKSGRRGRSRRRAKWNMDTYIGVAAVFGTDIGGSKKPRGYKPAVLVSITPPVSFLCTQLSNHLRDRLLTMSRGPRIPGSIDIQHGLMLDSQRTRKGGTLLATQRIASDHEATGPPQFIARTKDHKRIPAPSPPYGDHTPTYIEEQIKTVGQPPCATFFPPG